MTYRVPFTFIILTALVLPALWAPASADAPAPGAPARLIVAFHTLPEGAAAGALYEGAPIVGVIAPLQAIVVEAPDAARFTAAARADPAVRYVEEDGEVRALGFAPLFTPNDPRYGSLYGLSQIRAPLAWDRSLGDTTSAVCILDTGVRYTHEDLAGARWLGGRDFVNNDNDPWDDHGHGTHVAGTAAAGINNGKGIAGVANVGIYGVKVLSATGGGTWSNVASGITWCADNTMPRTVLSLSLGGSGASSLIHDAVKYANGTKGKLVVAAAGNDGPCSNCVLYPAKYPEAVAVTCTVNGETLCSFSSTGPEAEVAAPGNLILSTCHTGNADYCTMSGTSMSTPHASGLAALVWSYYPDMTAANLRRVLRETAQDLGAPGWDEKFGHGEVDAADAITWGGLPPAPPTAFTASPGRERIDLSWSAPADTGGLPLTAFRIYRRDPADANATLLTEVPGTARGFTDAPLEVGRTWVYRVSAVNTAGESPLSPEAQAAAYVPPGAPTGVQARIGTGVSTRGVEVRVTWNAPADTGGLPLTSYHVYRGLSDGHETLLAIVDAGPVPQYRDYTCPAGTTCYYRVAAAHHEAGPRSASASSPGTAAVVPSVTQHPDGSVSVYYDANGNGARDPGETLVRTPPVLP